MSDKGPSTFAILTVIASGLLGIALLSLATIAWQVIAQYRLLRLPQAAGTMESCDPIVSSSPGFSGGMSDRGFASMWTVKVRYRYSVGGISFEGEVFSQRKVGKISNRATFNDPVPKRIARLCRQYSAGSSVPVYYYPENPGKSFVYFNPPWTDWPWMLVPAMFGLAAGVFFFLAHIARKLG